MVSYPSLSKHGRRIIHHGKVVHTSQIVIIITDSCFVNLRRRRRLDQINQSKQSQKQIPETPNRQSKPKQQRKLDRPNDEGRRL